MPGQARTRSFSYGQLPSGKLYGPYSNNLLANSGQSYGTTKTTNDTLQNNGGQNLFLSTRVSKTGSVVNGYDYLYNGVPHYRYENWVPDCLVGAPTFPNMTLPNKFRDANQAIASSHPGESPFSLPNFLFELKDVPRMLNHAKNRARQLENAAKNARARSVYDYLRNPKNPAEDWLNYHFGWVPFIKDMQSIGGLSEWTSKRCSQLDRQIRRVRDLGEESTSASRSTTFMTGVGATQYATLYRHKWVSSRWDVSSHATQAMRESKAIATAYALGLDFSISQLWDAMPWSWLVDWFVGVGDIIHTYSNRAGITFNSAVLMDHERWDSHIVPNPHATLQVSTCFSSVEFKRRDYANPSVPSVGLNWFGPTQLATLASLAVTRVGR